MQRMFQPSNRLTPRQTAGLYKLAFATVLFLSQIQKVMGDTCFEIYDHDYTLSCGQGEADIYNKLVSQCGAYKDAGNVDDCARYFINTLDFCKGLFGDAMCQLQSHVDADPCAVEVIQSSCRNGATTFDYIVIGGIAIAGLSLLVCIGILVANCNRLFNRPAVRNDQDGRADPEAARAVAPAPVANEQSPLLPNREPGLSNPDSATVPVDSINSEPATGSGVPATAEPEEARSPGMRG